MKIHRNPSIEEISRIEKLINEACEAKEKFDVLFDQIDLIFGDILFGVASLRTHITERGKFEKFISEDERFEINNSFTSNNLEKCGELRWDILRAFIGVYSHPAEHGNHAWHELSFIGSDEMSEALTYIVSKIKEKTKFKKFNYYSPEFRTLRHKVFLRDGEICAKCGATPRPNMWIEIDHIKPVSKYPELALDIDNLQCLCRLCNVKKSNTDETDYRRKKQNENHSY